MMPTSYSFKGWWSYVHRVDWHLSFRLAYNLELEPKNFINLPHFIRYYIRKRTLTAHRS